MFKIKEVDGITNILLLGTDGRKNETAFRTDSMIILTIDNNHKNIKLTSLARDTYVSIRGKGKGKLNTAYFWGKEDLLFETIENEFGIGLDKYVIVDFTSLMDIIYALDGIQLNIKESEIKEDLLFETIENEFGIGLDKYVIVDFTSLMDIIYALDGIQLNIKESEIEEVNKFIPECYKFCKNPNKGEMKLIKEPGKQTLNGYQALSYSRIRKSDSAIFRDGRQRKVINAIIKKYQNVSFTKYPELIDAITPYVTTNLTTNEITSLAYTGHNILSGKSLKKVLKEGQFPITDEIHSKGGVYGNSGWVWLYDTNSTCVLRDFIYNDINMEDNKYLNESNKIELNY